MAERRRRNAHVILPHHPPESRLGILVLVLRSHCSNILLWLTVRPPHVVCINVRGCWKRVEGLGGESQRSTISTSASTYRRPHTGMEIRRSGTRCTGFTACLDAHARTPTEFLFLDSLHHIMHHNTTANTTTARMAAPISPSSSFRVTRVRGFGRISLYRLTPLIVHSLGRSSRCVTCVWQV